MRRLLVLILLIGLPLQFAWGAAAAYCQHEPSGKHFGHHQHQQHVDTSVESKDGKSPLVPSSDVDCQFCQLAGVSPVANWPSVLWVAPQGVHYFAYVRHSKSYRPPGPERPDRFLAV